MKKLLRLFIFCSVLVIATFLLFGNFEKWVEINLSTQNSKLTYTFLSFGLLTSDIVLPIPSSLVMILNGKILGCFWGTLISLFSGLLSSLIGFYMGKVSSPFVDRIFTEKDKIEANKFFNRFGNNAIIVSKALPIISETVSFVSGTTAISLKLFLFYSFVGHLIISIAYAIIGSYSSTINSSVISGVVILIALIIAWTIQIIMRKKNGT